MSRYSVSFVDLSDFLQLQSEWMLLERGADMTYFQQYHWYEMLVKANQNNRSSNYEIIFASVKMAESVVMIAPLWVVKRTFAKFNLAGVYGFDKGAFTDYYNFIYDRFDGGAVEALLKAVSQHYGLKRFNFEHLLKESRLFLWLQSRFDLNIRYELPCVATSIPETQEAYMEILSKSVRQNIRTAYNRARKDGIEFTFAFEEEKIDLQEFKRLREIGICDRHSLQAKRNYLAELKDFISKKILRHGAYYFPYYVPFTDDKSSRFMTVKSQKGDLCAAFNYGIDLCHNRIVLMTVCTHPEYYRYSPGVLCLYEFIMRQIETHGYRTLDCTIGTERYKYDIGGKENYIEAFDFSFE